MGFIHVGIMVEELISDAAIILRSIGKIINNILKFEKFLRRPSYYNIL